MLLAKVLDKHDGEARMEQRTNMFVLAAVSSASASGPIKIRNMSPGGALIEGAALPAIGEQLQLLRGASSAKGSVVWSTASKAGVRFDGRVEVSEWTPGGNAAQQRVDDLVQQVKVGALPLATAERSAFQGLTSPDLERLARAVDALADAMADDPVTIVRFGSKLQTLDITAQVLRKIAQRG